MDNNNWANNPRLKNIDPNKLQMIMTLADQGGNKKQSEMMPFLLSAASKSKSQGLSFTSDEIEVIIDVLKSGKSKEEIKKIEKMRSIMKMM